MVTDSTFLTAIVKDYSRRYISVLKLQSDGRLELDKTCVDVLRPLDGEEFVIINDNSSIILARRPLEIDTSKVLSSTRWESSKNRIRLPPSVLRILLACKIGVKAFRYNNETVLEFEPFIPPPDIKLSEVHTFSDLAPYVLRSPRSVLHVDVIDAAQTLPVSDLTFRILGEYWGRFLHVDPVDSNLKPIICERQNCSACNNNFPIIKKTYWFPIIAYEHGFNARPALLSFRAPRTMNIFVDLLTECHRWARVSNDAEAYFRRGVIDYTGTNLYKLNANDSGLLQISEVPQMESRALTIEEKGLMKIALKELEASIKQYEASSGGLVV